MREQGDVYLDVRTEEEFALGHPEGAFNLPLRTRDGEQLVDNPHFARVLRACFAPAQALIVGCERGERSREAAAQMHALGYTAVVELPAGYGGQRDAFGRVLEKGWRACGLPCASEPAPGHDYAALLERTQSTASGNGGPGRANK